MTGNKQGYHQSGHQTFTQMRYTTKVTLSSQPTLGNFGRVWTSDVIGDQLVKDPPVPRYSCPHFQRSIKPLDLQPLAQRLYIWGQYIDRDKNKVTKYPTIKISYTGNYLFCKLDSYTKVDKYVVYTIILVNCCKQQVVALE